MERVFREELCWNATTQKPTACISDEFYVPTMMTALGYGNQTSCTWSVVSTDWGNGAFCFG